MIAINKLREAAAESPASASRISFLHIGRPSVGGFFVAVISGKSYEWWREYLITALEFLDNIKDKVSDNVG
jgi:hypothetical protein